jgi:hypothetical protein
VAVGGGVNSDEININHVAFLVLVVCAMTRVELVELHKTVPIM